MGSVDLGRRDRAAVAGGPASAQEKLPVRVHHPQGKSSGNRLLRGRLLCSSALARARAALVEACLRVYPGREVFIRTGGRMRYVSVPPWAQATALLVGLLMAGWVGFTTSHYLLSGAVLQSKEQQMRETRAAHRASLGEVDRYRAQLAEVAQRLDERGREVAAMVSRSGLAPGPRRVSGAEDFALRFGRPIGAEAGGTDGQAAAGAAFEPVLWRGVDRLEQDLKTVIDGRAALINQRDRLQFRVKELEGRLASLRSSQETVLRRITQSTSNRVIEVEKLIAITSLEVNQMLDRLKQSDAAVVASIAGGQGGPFVELASAPLPADDPLTSKVVALDEKMERWHDLQRLLRILPLAAPADHYRLTSGFGRRVDPLRKRWAHHDGVDLAHHSGTPVLATAPGTVTFTGWRGNYGRTVEVDHGLGVRTRYSHLKKILVKTGQRVEFRDKIGLMGSSGRSTGTHLHYEVRVDEKPLNPIKFMKAGKYVFQGK